MMRHSMILCLIIEFKLLAINIGAMLFPSQVPDLNIQVRNLTITEITSVTSVKAFPLLPLCSRCNTPFTQQRALHRLLWCCTLILAVLISTLCWSWKETNTCWGEHVSILYFFLFFPHLMLYFQPILPIRLPKGTITKWHTEIKRDITNEINGIVQPWFSIILQYSSKHLILICFQPFPAWVKYE